MIYKTIIDANSGFHRPIVDCSTPDFVAHGNGSFSAAGLFAALSKGHLLIDITQDELSGSVGATGTELSRDGCSDFLGRSGVCW